MILKHYGPDEKIYVPLPHLCREKTKTENKPYHSYSPYPTIYVIFIPFHIHNLHRHVNFAMRIAKRFYEPVVVVVVADFVVVVFVVVVVVVAEMLYR